METRCRGAAWQGAALDTTALPGPSRYLAPPLPTVFTLELTQRCGHACLGCGNVFEHTSLEMGFENWQVLLEKIQPYARALRVTGGEPTLHRDFPRLLKAIDQLGIPFSLFTNASWHDPEKILDRLQECDHLQGLLISLHGDSRSSYQAYTRVDAFDRVAANIRCAVDRHIRVATNTLLLETTCLRLPEIAALAHAWGVSTISFGRYYGLPIAGITLSPDSLQEALYQVAQMRQADPAITLSNCVPACFLPGVDFGGRGCTSGFTHVTIGPFGAIRPCTHTPLVLGSLFTDDIPTVWSGSLLEGWRRQVPGDCLGCQALSRCRGGCRATAQQLGISADPLFRQSLKTVEPLPTVVMHPDDRPCLSCLPDQTSYGFALSGVGRFVTLSPHSKPILDMLDGQHTISQIQECFGYGAVQLVGSLFQIGMVSKEYI